MVKIFRYSKVKGNSTPMHSHHYQDLCEIYYMVSGECIYYIDDVATKSARVTLYLFPKV